MPELWQRINCLFNDPCRKSLVKKAVPLKPHMSVALCYQHESVEPIFFASHAQHITLKISHFVLIFFVLDLRHNHKKAYLDSSYMDDFGDMRRVDRSDTYDASLPRDYLGYDLIQDNLCGPIDKNSAYLPCFIHECKNFRTKYRTDQMPARPNNSLESRSKEARGKYVRILRVDKPS